MHTTNCKICGKEFTAKHPNSRYCCARCRLDYESAYHKKWREDNREHYREYQRAYKKGK